MTLREDVTLTLVAAAPAVEFAIPGLSGPAGPPGPPGPGAVRTTTTYTTAALPDGATEVGALTIDKAYRLLRLQVDRACRVRLYATAAQRDADLARPLGVKATGDHGLMLEFAATAALAATLSPMVDGASLETPPGRSVPAAVTNRSGAAGPVTLTLTYLPQEV